MKAMLIRAIWDGGKLRVSIRVFRGMFSSVEALPRWIQERYAVLRLLEEHEPSPLGKWSISRDTKGNKTLWLYIVRQPGDPEWETA